ncbi:MAG: hypothetical protein ACREUT_10615 [Steroidobacteraceae bacterium]
MRGATAKGGESAAGLCKCAAVLVVAGVLAACTAMTRMSSDAPANVTLAGTWKLDPQHSTDSNKALENLMKTARRAQRSTRRYGAGGTDGFGSDAALLAPPRLVFAPDISLQRSLLANGEWLKIDQRPGEFVVANAEGSRSYVPGERSVVSVPGGVADQRSGWKSHEYWISLKPQVGPSATETFKLSPDRKQLVEIIDIARDGRIPALKVTRVYVPTQEEAPSAVPSED